MSKAWEILEQMKALDWSTSEGLEKWRELFDAYNKRLAEEEVLERQWIKCSDRLPLEPDGSVTFETVKVLVSDDCGRVYAAEFARGGGHVGMPWAEWAHNDVESHIVTHWMPLPNPPDESE